MSEGKILVLGGSGFVGRHLRARLAAHMEEDRVVATYNGTPFPGGVRFDALSMATDTFTILNHYHEMEERFDRPYAICPNIQFNPVIGGDCVVYSCHDKAFTKGGTLGSIKERSFKEFWFSEENRERVYAIDPSRNCSHHCADHVKNLGMMDYLSIDPEHGQFV